MEEKDVNKTETVNVKTGAILLGAYILGCVVGAAANNKKVNEAYSKGVMDTFKTLMSTQK